MKRKLDVSTSLPIVHQHLKVPTNRKKIVVSRINHPLPPLSEINEEKLMNDTTIRISNEELFDTMMANCNTVPVNEAIEPAIQDFFNCEKVLFWEERILTKTFFCRILDREILLTNEIFTELIEKKLPLAYNRITDPGAMKQFGIDPTISHLFLPIRILNGHAIAIIICSKSAAFDEQDMELAKFIMKKFNIYGANIFAPTRNVQLADSISTFSDVNTTVTSIVSRLQSIYQCNIVDIWYFHVKTQQYARFNQHTKEFIGIYKFSAGIVGHALRMKEIVNETHVKNNTNFIQAVDGDPELPILITTNEFSGRVWAIALRGECKNGKYSIGEQTQLETITYFAARSISYAAGFIKAQIPPTARSDMKLTHILDDSALFTCSLDMTSLIPSIQERCASLVNASMCRLLIVDHFGKEFRYDFGNSLQDHKKYPLTFGIAGACVYEKQPLKIKNPTKDTRYDRRIDVGSHMQVNNIMAIPIMFHGIVTGVIIVVNKLNCAEFDDSDQDSLSTVSQFAGIALHNAQTYQLSLNISNQLEQFVIASTQQSLQSSHKETLEEIISHAREVIKASRATLFLTRNIEPFLYEHLTVGERLEHGTEYAEIAFQTKKTSTHTMSFSTKKSNVEKPAINDLFESDDDNDKSTIFICCTPLLSSDQSVLGVMEFGCPSNGSQEEIDLIESFASIVSISIERKQLKEVIEMGQDRISLKLLCGTDEVFDTYQTPEQLVFKPELGDLLSPSFIVDDLSPHDLCCAVFTIFDKFNLRRYFKITNLNMYTFVTKLANSYDNWARAVDSTQFLAIMIIEGKLDKVLIKQEIFALITACICHDAGHEELLDESNPLTYTPHAILYKNQSINETHNCTAVIEILTKEDCNIFINFDQKLYKRMWKSIIKLIIATDMGKHYKIMNTFDQLVSQEIFGLKVQKHRDLLMKMIIKIADMSRACRDFEIASASRDELCKDFFNHGDLDQAEGLHFDSENEFDRKHLNREKSVLGFYQYVCLPPFRLLTHVLPDLMPFTEKLEENVEKWKQEDFKRRAKEDAEEAMREKEEKERLKSLENQLVKADEDKPDSQETPENKEEKSKDSEKTDVKPEEEKQKEPEPQESNPENTQTIETEQANETKESESKLGEEKSNDIETPEPKQENTKEEKPNEADSHETKAEEEKPTDIVEAKLENVKEVKINDNEPVTIKTEEQEAEKQSNDEAIQEEKVQPVLQQEEAQLDERHEENKHEQEVENEKSDEQIKVEEKKPETNETQHVDPNTIRSKLVKSEKEEEYETVEDASASEMSKKSEGSIINKMSRDFEEFSNSTMELEDITLSST